MENERLVELVGELRENVAALWALVGGQGENQIERRNRVLLEVYNRGGIVTPEEWHVIGDEVGYNRQGLGGFFVGRNASMVKISGDSGTRFALSPKGMQNVETHLRSHPE